MREKFPVKGFYIHRFICDFPAWKLTSLLLILVLVSGTVLAQQPEREISGTIVEASNSMPIPGANILIKGTNSGTISDLDGKYNITVKEGATLVFSFIGMLSKEVLVGNQRVIDVALEVSYMELEEVIAVGYGTQKKSDVTGSVASFDTEVIKERPQTNIIQALQGNMAGITVKTNNSSAEDEGIVLIRGQNSITASNDPLIILDGIPYDGTFSEINPNDISSMEVLKDASSTAIYGSRGANGVIIINTKQGRSGKMDVSYSGYYSYDQVAQLPDMQDASDYWRDKWERNVINSLSVPSNSLTIKQTLDNVFEGDETDNTELEAFMQGYPGQTWAEVRDGILAGYPDQVHGRDTLLRLQSDFAYPSGGRNTDWLGLASRLGHKQQHNLSVSGGGERYNYFVSGIYDKNQGIARGDDFERMIFRMNLSFELIEGITYGTNTQIGFYDRSGIPADWGANSKGAFRLSPLYNALYEDGSIDLFPINEDTNVENPLEPLLFENEDNETRVITNHYLDIDFPWVKGLHYKLNTGFRWNAQDDKTYKGLNTVEGSRQDGVLYINNRKGNAWTLENILSYKRDFGIHTVFLTGLYSAQKSVDEYNGMVGKGFQSDVMKFYQPASADLLTGDARYTQKSYISQMFRANYVYDGRYLITGTIRRDGYSAFGVDTKFGLFPSLALGWNIANEGFMQSVDAISILKLRLSYGESGNEAVRPYSKLPVMAPLNYLSEDETSLYGYFPKTLANPGLGWETTKSYNIGLDFNFFRGRIYGSVDAYSSRTYDLLLNETISAINGTTSITRNIGETENKGFEMQLSTVTMHRGDFIWKSALTASIFRSKIVNVGLKDEEGNYIDDLASEWFIGHPVSVNFDYSLDRILQNEDFIRDDEGNFVLDENDNYQLLPEVRDALVLTTSTVRPGQPVVKDVNKDGFIGGSEDKELHGDENPSFTAGLSNTFSYRNWTFSFFLNGVWGVTKRNTLINNKGLGPTRKLNISYWTPENPTTALPGLNRGSMTSPLELWPYFDANYVRVQDVTLSYKLPTPLLQKIHIENTELFINIRNLHTFTKWEGLDPDYNTRDDSSDGVSLDIPRPRSFIFGIRLTI